jgi:hypothetical protein
VRPTTSNSGLRLAARAAALAGCVFVVTVCGEQGKYPTTPGGSRGGSGPGVNVQIPAKTDTVPVAVGDSVFVQVSVNDSRGVTGLILTGNAVRGSVDLGTDTTVERFTSRTVTLPGTRDTVITRYLRAVLSDSTSEFVTIAALAVNTANDTTEDTSLVRVVNGPRVTVLQPAAGAVTAVGKTVTVEVRGVHPQGVKVLGWRATGVVTASDSTIFAPVSGALPDTELFSSSLAVPTGTATGSIVIVPFGTDSLDDPSGVAPGVTVSVQTVVGDTVAPLVQDTMPRRVEVDDSLTVTATDASGITRIGFLVFDSTGATLVGGDSVNLPGTSTNISQRFSLALDTLTTFPRVVRVQAFALDGAATANRGVSTTGTTPRKTNPSIDTLTVVAGRTISLPQGGQFGDAVFNPNRNELYLTNTALNQIEVFQLSTNTFATPIRVGSQPLGIALWPRDTLGDNADTVIVANSGGTNLSIVDMVSRAEVQRRRLANYIVQTVKTQPSAAGGVEILTTDYELADRPEYVGAVCRHETGAGACDSVYAVYSTAPTPAQPGPFTNRGYLASENLSAPVSGRSGHFFYELAQPGTDTLQIIAVRDTLPGQPIRDTILGAGVGDLITLSTLAFQESTYVRNSGDFNHVVIGEGGLDQGFARALAVDGRAPIVRTTPPPLSCPLLSPTSDSVLTYLNCNATVDEGVSPGILVRDFLVNRAAKVLSVATNFNGRTSLVRADSIYAFDYTLRQTGLLPVPSGQPGMDFDPLNAFDANTRTSGSLSKNDRLVFAARPDPFIDVFDTYWYARVATVPIRDTINGPIRVARVGGVLVLVGVTPRGLVVVRLPSFTNPYPVRQPPAAIGLPAAAGVARPGRGGSKP